MYTFNLQYIISLGWEDPLEEGMATHSIFLPEESSWTEEPGGLQSMGLQRVTHDWETKHRAYLLNLIIYYKISICFMYILYTIIAVYNNQLFDYNIVYLIISHC